MRFVFAVSVAEYLPAPSPAIARLWKAPGVVVVASRQKSVAERPAEVTSTSSQEIVTASVDFGTAGECFTFVMNGAVFATAMEFTAPGVPPPAAELPQFCPLPLSTRGLRSSRVRPPLFASDCQSQPFHKSSRTRSAQSPSSA